MMYACAKQDNEVIWAIQRQRKQLCVIYCSKVAHSQFNNLHLFLPNNFLMQMCYKEIIVGVLMVYDLYEILYYHIRPIYSDMKKY